MSKTNQRILSMILTVIMIVGFFPTSVFADSSESGELPAFNTVTNIPATPAPGESNESSDSKLSGDSGTKTATVIVGDSIVLDGEGTGIPGSWNNQNEDVVDLDSDGDGNQTRKATALKPGTATIVRKYTNWRGSHTITFVITVVPKVTTKNYTLNLGSTQQLTLTDFYYLGNGSGAEVNITVDKSSVAKYVDGKFVATGIGTTSYTVEVTSNGCTGSANGSITVQPAISMPSPITLYEGETKEVTAGGEDVSAAAYDFAISGTSGVASVSGNGKTVAIVGIAPGSTTLTSTLTLDGKTYSVESDVTVLSNATIETEKSVDVYFGLSKSLSATVGKVSELGKQHSNDEITWEVVSGAEYVKFSGSGSSATIESTNYAGVGKDVQIKLSVGDVYETVTVHINNVSFGVANAEEKLVIGGESYTPSVYASVQNEDQDAAIMAKLAKNAITWSSDNTDVATVNKTTGEITAHKAGTANITASVVYNGETFAPSNACAVTVVSNAKAILFAKNSSDVGTSTLDLEVVDGGTVTAYVYVDLENTNISTKNTIDLQSSNPAKVEITNIQDMGKGKYSFDIVGHDEGNTATITATSEELTATSTVKVVSNIKNISNPNEYELPLGVSKKVISDNALDTSVMFVTYSDASGKKITTEAGTDGYYVSCSSSDQEIVRVNSDGTMTAVKEGEAKITVSVAGTEYQFYVTVKGSVISINTDPTSVELDTVLEPKTYDLASITTVEYADSEGKLQTAKLSDDSCPENIKDAIVWTSLNSDIATVDKNGVVTAVKSGYATITYEVEGKTQNISVTVKSNGVTPENGTTMYLLTIHYKFGSGENYLESAADDFVASFCEGSSVHEVIESPTNVIGYAPAKASFTFDCERITSPYEYTIYYYPSTTTFTVEYYCEQIDNNASSYKLDSSKQITAITEDVVEKYATDIEKTITGYIRTPYNRTQQVAADGSTVVAVYYNRSNVLVSLDLRGGTGTDPIYGTWGSKVSVSTPTKAGYTFNGWVYDSGDSTVFSNGNNTAVIPQTASSYHADWVASSNTQYSVIHKLENTEGTGYDYETTTFSTGVTGGTTSASGQSFTGFHLYGSNPTKYPSETDSNYKIAQKTIAGDGSTIITVYYNRNTYTVNWYPSKNSKTPDKTITGKYMQFVGDEWPGGVYYVNNSQNSNTSQSYLRNLDKDYNFYKNTNETSSNPASYYVELIGDGSDTSEKISGTNYKLHHEDKVISGYQVTEDDMYSLGEGYTFNASKSSKEGASWTGAKFYYDRNTFQIDLIDNNTKTSITGIKYEYSLDQVKSDLQTKYKPADKSGYTFAGWYDNPQCEGEAYVLPDRMPDYNLVLYAKWEPVKVSLTVFSDSIDSGSVKITDIPRGSVLSDYLSNNGYDISSWSALKSGDDREFIGFYKMDGNAKGNAFTFDSQITEDTVVKAFFRDDKTYNVEIRYYSEDGTQQLADTDYSSLVGGDGCTYDAKVIPVPDGSFLWLPLSNSHSILADPRYTADEEVSYDSTKSKFTYTFKYTQKEKIGYTVLYVDAYGKQLATPKTAQVKQNIVTENAAVIDGYKAREYQKQLLLCADEAKNVITFVYDESDGNANVVINHWKQDADDTTSYSTKLATSDVISASVGSTFDYSQYIKEVSGYAYNADKTVKTPTNGVVSENGLVINLKYDRNAISYTVNYKLRKADGTTVELKPSVTKSAPYGSTVKETAEDVAGATLSSNVKTAVINTTDINITFVYSENRPSFYYVSRTDGCTVTPTSNLSVPAIYGTAEGSTANDTDGYTFLGWYSDKECTNLVSTDADFDPPKTNGVYTSGATYYAKWQAADLSASYQWAFEGEDWEDKDLYDEAGTEVNTPSVPTIRQNLNPGKQYNVEVGETNYGKVYYTHDAYGNVNGKYTFTGYTIADANGNAVTLTSDKKYTMPGTLVVITGTWKYTAVDVAYHSVKYEYSWDTEDVEIPTTLPTGAALPSNSKASVNQPILLPTKVNTTIDVFDEYNNKLGYWKFDKWTSSASIMGDSDVTITGHWVFEATKEKLNYTVKYTVTGTVPSSYTKPADKDYRMHSTVSVESVPSIEGYSFSGWTPEQQLTVNNGKFEMPNQNVEFTGVFTKSVIKINLPTNETISAEYDGQPHGVEITTDPTSKVEYSTDGGTTWSDTPPYRTDAGITTVTVRATKDNYDVATGTYKIVVTPKAATVTADDKTKVYGAVDPEFTATVNGTVSGESLVYKFTRAKGEDVGTYQIDVTADSAKVNDNYTITFKSGTLTITKSNSGDFKFNDLTGYEGNYDGNNHGFTATVPDAVKDGTTIEYSVDGGNTWTTTVPEIKNVNETVTVQVRATNKNYETITGSFKLEVTPVNVTVTADNLSKTIGEKDPALTATVVGTIGNDKVTYKLTREDGETKDTYVITVTGDETQGNGNYNVAYTNGVFTINYRTGLDFKNLESYVGTYNGNPHSLPVEPNINGAKIYYSTDDGATWSEEVPTRTNAGTTTVKVKVELEDYETKEGEYTLTVSPKEVVINVADATKRYGTEDPEFTATVDGLIGTDTIAYTLSRDPGNELNKSYPITATYEALQGNYTVTSVPGEFTITEGQITITNPNGTNGEGYTGVYDGAEHGEPVTADVKGALIEYSVDGGSWTTTAPTIKDTGKLTVKVRVTATNYDKAETSYVLEVTRKEVTVTAENKEIIYGADEPEYTAKVETLVGEDTIEYSFTRNGGNDVGTYDIVPTGKEVQGNYKVKYVNGTLTITASDNFSFVDMEKAGYTGVYDGQEHAGNVQVSVTEGTTIVYSTDETEEKTWSATAPTIKNAGEIKVYVRATNKNYTTVSGEYTLKVEKAKVTVKADNVYKEFNTADPELTATVTGEVNNERVQYDIVRAEGTAVGDYDITVTPKDGYSNDNYDITYTKGTFTITYNDGLEIAGLSYEGIYDGTAHGTAATASIDGTETTDATISYSTDGGVTYKPEYPTITNVGGVTVTVKAEMTGYTTVTETYTLKVNPKEVTIKADASQGKRYGASDPVLTATIDDLVKDEDESTIKYTLKRAGGDAIGEYDITAEYEELQGNYRVKFEGAKFTISEGLAPQIVLPDGGVFTYEYDGDSHGDPVTSSPKEDVTILYSTDGKNWTETPPTRKDVGTTTVYVKTQSDLYEDQTEPYPTYQIVVTARPITITVDNAAKYVGEKDPEFTSKVTKGNLVEGEQLVLNYNRSNPTAETAGTYTITAAADDNADVNKNYNITFVDGTLTISKNTKPSLNLPDGGVFTYEYDGDSHGDPVTSSPKEDVTILYSTDGKNWTETPPTATNAGETTVYVKTGGDVYEEETGSYKIVITPKKITITVDDKSKVYGDNDPEFTVTDKDKGIVSGDTLYYTFSRETGNNVGEYAISAEIDKNNAQDEKKAYNNYDVTFNPGTLTITKATGKLELNIPENVGYGGQYDGQYHGGTVGANITEGTTIYYYYEKDGVTGWYTDAPTRKDVGTTEVQVKAENDNYETATGKYTITVLKRDVKAQPVSVSKLYGEKDPEFTISTENFVEGEELVFKFTRKSGEDYSEDGYKITASVDTDKTAAEVYANYNVKFETGTLTINKRNVKLVSATSSKEYDGKEYVDATVNVEGDKFKDGEGATFNVTGKQKLVGSSENKFTYALKSGTKTINYNITCEYGTLTVTGSKINGEKKVDKSATTDNVIYYNISVTNNSSEAIAQVELTEKADSKFVETDTNKLYVNNLEAGETRTVRAYHELTEQDRTSGGYVNEVTIKHGDDEIIVTSDETTQSVTPKLTLYKEVYEKPAVVTVGSTIRYKITVANEGNVSLTNVEVVDEKTGDTWNKTNKSELAEILPGSKVVLYADYTVVDSDLTSGVTNTVKAKADPITYKEKDETGKEVEKTVTPEDEKTSTPVTVETPTEGLDVKKEVVSQDDDPLRLGDWVKYKITVTNNDAADYYNVVITDAKANNFSKRYDKLASGDSIVEEISYQITSADILNGGIENEVRVDAVRKETPTSEGTPVQNSDKTGNLETEPVNTTLTVTKAIDGTYSNVKLGDKIKFIITVKNEGNVAYNNVRVEDELLGMTGTKAYVIEELGPNTSYDVPVEYTVTSADILKGYVVNTASAVADRIENPNYDPNDPTKGDEYLTPNGSSDPTDKIPTEGKNGQLEVTKTVKSELKSVTVGSQIVYTITVENTGNVDIHDITVSDPQCNNWSEKITVLKPTDEAVEFDVTYTVTEADILAGGVANKAFADGKIIIPSTTPDGKPTEEPVHDEIINDKVKTDSLNGTIGVDKEVTSIMRGNIDVKNTSKLKLEVGDVINYQITVTNAGNVTFKDVVVVDEFTGNTWDKSNTPEFASMVPATAGSEASKVVLTTSHTVTSEDILSGGVKNVATATGTITDENGNPVPNPDPDHPEEPFPAGKDETSEIPTEAIDRTISINKTISGIVVDNEVKPVPENGVNVGDVVQFVITVTNKGNVPYTSVKVIDNMLGYTKESPYAVKLNSNELLPGEDVTLPLEDTRYTVTADDVLSGKVQNSATVIGGPIPEPGEEENPEDTKQVPKDDTDSPAEVPTSDIVCSMDLTKSVKTQEGVEPTNATLGSKITYVLTIKNTSDYDFVDVKVTDAKVNWTNKSVGELKKGETKEVTLPEYTVTEADILQGYAQNTATVTATIKDKNNNKHDFPQDVKSPGKDADPKETPKDNNPEVTVPINGTISVVKEVKTIKRNGKIIWKATDTNKEVSGVELAIDDIVTYSFTVKNEGNVTFNGVEITDSKTGYSKTVNLAPEEVVTDVTEYRVKTQDITDGGLTNTITAKGQPIDNPDGGEPITPYGEGTNGPVATEEINPSLTVTKTVKSQPNTVTVDSKIIYTITVENTGNVDIQDITVSDPQCNNWSKTIEILKPTDDALTFDVTYTVTEKDVIAGSVANTAYADGKVIIPGKTPDENPTEKQIHDEITNKDIKTEKLNGTIGVEKKVTSIMRGDTDVMNTSKLKLEAGDVINYQITVTNDGNVTFKDVVVVDELTGNTWDKSNTPEFESMAPATAGSEASKVVLTTSYTVTSADILSGGVKNVATATGTITDENGNPVKNPDNPEEPFPGGKGETSEIPTEAIDRTISINKKITGIVVDNEVKPVPENGVNVGDVVQFVITVTNKGNVPYTSVKVIDNMLGYTKESPYAVELNSNELLPGEDVTLPLEDTRYTVTADDVLSGKIQNSATVIGGPIPEPGEKENPEDPTQLPKDDTDIPAEVPTSDIVCSMDLTKSVKTQEGVEPTNATLGSKITYVLTIKNTSDYDFVDVKVTDAKVNWTNKSVGELKKGETKTVELPEYTVTEADILQGYAQNTATVTATIKDKNNEKHDFPQEVSSPGKDADPKETPKDNNPEVTVPINGTISVVKEVKTIERNGKIIWKATDANKEVSGVELAIDDIVTYSFTVKNEGNVTFKGVEITDSKTGYSKTVNLAPEQVISDETEYRVKTQDITDGGLTNTITAKGQPIDNPNGGDPITPYGEGTNGPVATEEINPSLAITKTVKSVEKQDKNSKSDKVTTGDKITFEIYVKNDGNVTLENVKVEDVLTGNVGENVLTCDKLEPNKDHTFTIVYTVKEDDLYKENGIINTATVSADPINVPEPDDPTKTIKVEPKKESNPTDPVSTDDVNVDLDLTKTVVGDSNKEYKAGETVKYSITVTNNGNVTVKNVKVNDVLENQEFEVGDLEPTKSRTVTLNHTVTYDDVLNGRVINKATADGTVTKKELVEDPNNPGTYIENEVEVDKPHKEITNENAKTEQANVSMTLEKEVENKKSEYKVGDTIYYKITVTNTGNVPLENIVVTDTIINLGNKGKIDVLNPGRGHEIFAEYTVKSSDLLNGGVVNVASATADEVTKKVREKDPETDEYIYKEVTEKPEQKTGEVKTETEEARFGLDLTKTVDKSKNVVVGDVLTYTITLKNTGNISVTGIVVEDKKTGMKETVSEIAGGQEMSWQTKYTVTETDIKSGSLSNEVTLKTDKLPEINGKTPDAPENAVNTIDLTRKLTVYYQFTDGTEASAKVEKVLKQGESYTITNPTISGYKPTYQTVTGTMGKNDTSVIVLYYKEQTTTTTTTTTGGGTVNTNTTKNKEDEKTEYSLVIHYIYEGGKKAADDYTAKIEKGKNFLVKSPEITGYDASVKYVYSKEMTSDTEVTVTYTKSNTTATTVAGGTGNNDGTGDTWGEANGYTIEEIEEEQVPLAIKDSMKDDCMLHMLIMLLALGTQVYYVVKKKKYEEDIFELQQQIIALE